MNFSEVNDSLLQNFVNCLIFPVFDQKTFPFFVFSFRHEIKKGGQNIRICSKKLSNFISLFKFLGSKKTCKIKIFSLFETTRALNAILIL